MNLLAATAWIILASSLAVEHAPVVERGVAGLQTVVFTVRNAGEVPMSCSVSIAHWYSLSLGTAPPNGVVTTSLWFDPLRGAVFKMTKDDVRLPVEILWCGLEGHSWETRFEADMPRQIGIIPQPISLICAAETGRLRCH